MKVRPSNTLANHPSYPKILESYTMILREKGKVNAKKFYEDVILKEIPTYHMQSWYQFLRRFKTEAGIVPITKNKPASALAIADAEQGMEQILVTNVEATQQAIAKALNISARALQEIMENPELVPPEKRAELFLKVMKAQDSRVKAIGGVRADNREQERFDRAMDSALFS